MCIFHAILIIYGTSSWTTSNLVEDITLHLIQPTIIRVPALPLGSDFPIESPDPRKGIYSAVTRQYADGTSVCLLFK